MTSKLIFLLKNFTSDAFTSVDTENFEEKNKREKHSGPF